MIRALTRALARFRKWNNAYTFVVPYSTGGETRFFIKDNWRLDSPDYDETLFGPLDDR